MAIFIKFLLRPLPLMNNLSGGHELYLSAMLEPSTGNNIHYTPPNSLHYIFCALSAYTVSCNKLNSNSYHVA